MVSLTPPITRPSDHINDPLLDPIITHALAKDPEFQRFGYGPPEPDGLADYLFATPTQPHGPADVFPRLRWGGQFVFAAPYARQVSDLATRFAQAGFIVELAHGSLRQPPRFFFLPGPKIHYFIARKVRLIQSGEVTDRFTYEVHLDHCPSSSEYVVCKQVPTADSVAARLRKRRPDIADDTAQKRARKFTERIFPTFLTREAAILMILQEHLPPNYARLVPRVIAVEKDSNGLVQQLRMNWLRNNSRPLSQLEFAMQSADLLRAIHDAAKIIHLDLRLDNFVITNNGVGFVDFGSSVRVDEDVNRSPLLSTLFGELMRTSQIQRMLYQMAETGLITAEHIRNSYGRINKSIDVFYLAVQFNAPHSNPDLRSLICYDPTSPQAKALSRLTHQVLKPTNPAHPAIQTAKDILQALEQIDHRLHKCPAPAVPQM